VAAVLAWSTISHAYEISNRWATTATNGSTGLRGDPITLTWGLVSDGTTISGSEGSTGSILINYLDTKIGGAPPDTDASDLTQRPWFAIFTSSYGRIAELSGVTYVYEPKNSTQPIDASLAPTGSLWNVPDIRIGGHSIDGSSGANTLAYSYFPNHSDLVLDTDNANYYGNASNNYRAFRNILMHESGHGLGIDHVASSNAAFLMEANLGTNFDGPQLDDILALQRNYGDALEKNGGNDVFGKATVLGSLVNGAPLRIGTNGDTTAVAATDTDFVSIDGTSDIDFFSFTLERTLDVTLNLTPRGAIYNQGPQGGTQTSQNTKMFSDLTLGLFDTNGTTLLGLANNNGLGLGESLSRQLTPGTYYARVTGANDDVQLYGLDLFGTRVAASLTWTGSHSNSWDVNTSENFVDSVGPVNFYNQDQVTFDDTAASRAVNIAQNVEPASILVNTANTYTFTGPGGIVAGSLTLAGGTLELANDGNTYSGPTDVQAGTLIVVTATGTGDTTVHDGAIVGGGGMIGGNLVALNGATVQPGGSLLPSSLEINQDPTLTVDGDYTQANGATLEVQLRSLTDFDTLIVTGAASLDGSLSIQLGDNFMPTAGERYDILTASDGIAGTFANLLLPDLGGFLTFNALYEANIVALTVIPLSVTLPGDFDGDGDVDGRDFLVWQRGGSPNPLSAEDLAEWRAAYAPGGMATFAAMSVSVPEPATGVSLLIGLVGLLARRRHS
jgi:autotransporter-associated beta strand protein